MKPELADLARRGEQALHDLGFPGIRVDACGVEGEIASLSLPDYLFERFLGEEGDEISSRLRALGFRYVTVDLSPAG